MYRDPRATAEIGARDWSLRMQGAPKGLLSLDGLEALAKMEEALALLDRCEETGDSGGHLDLAICRLRDLMAKRGLDLPARPSDLPDA